VHDAVAKEVQAVRASVGIMDICAFTKVEVSGTGASPFLDNLVANNLPKKAGGIVLTHFLNERGRIELEATIIRLDDDRFYIVCAAFFEQRLLDHLSAYTLTNNITVTNRSDSWGAVSINGPRARDVLSACTDAALDNGHFRWLSAQAILIADKPCWAFRISYAGELGWEIHTERNQLLSVYDALWRAGESHGIRDYGSFAMNTMRMEKMFKGAGELTNEVTLPEADVMRFVKLDKDFIGKTATLTSYDKPLRWVCAYLEIESNGVDDGHGGEAVLLDDAVVGSTASVAYGHSVGKILAFAYVKPVAAIAGKQLQVVIAGIPRRAQVLTKPAYDPESLLPRTDS
jgi:dimethylglycine dehydrogenase